MNRRLMTILLCAFFVAAGASYVVYRLVNKQIGNGSRKPMVKIVVATRELEIGTLLKATDVKYGELAGEAPKDVLLKIESAVGRGVISTIYAGESVYEKRLARVGSGAGLASTIPPGMRACAVKVNEVVGVAGFAVPGMRVDVLIIGNTPGAVNPGGTKVRTLLQNIEVLSAGKNFQRDDEGKPVEVAVVNLLVDPEQAELLSLASSNETRIQLVLRNPIDREITTPPGSELATLFGGLPPEPPPPPPPAAAPRPAPVAVKKPIPTPVAPAAPAFVIQVLNGAKRTEQSFDAPGTKQ